MDRKTDHNNLKKVVTLLYSIENSFVAGSVSIGGMFNHFLSLQEVKGVSTLRTQTANGILFHLLPQCGWELDFKMD